MNGFALLEEKYGDPALYLDGSEPQPAAPPHPSEAGQAELGRDGSRPHQPRPLTHWRDSHPVVLLSAFLKECNDQGIHLQATREGRPVIYFWPALKDRDQDPDRWNLALHAWDLLARAREDLEDLILHGLISLPQNRWI